MNDLGAGSKVNKGDERRVGEISKSTALPSKYGRLIYRLIKWGSIKNAIELGTGTGISSLYITSAMNDGGKFHTLEGDPELISFAKHNLSRINDMTNISLISGDFDDNLAPLLERLKKVDFVLMDGNHKYDATLRYFKQISPYLHPNSIVVLDDIRWSKEMLTAWNEIKLFQSVTCSIDLFRVGLLFFKKELLKPQHISYKY